MRGGMTNRHFHRANQPRVIRQQQFRLLAYSAHASVPGERIVKRRRASSTPDRRALSPKLTIGLCASRDKFSGVLSRRAEIAVHCFRPCSESVWLAPTYTA